MAVVAAAVVTGEAEAEAAVVAADLALPIP